jgi:predicted nucleic acid-binding protein
MIIDTDVLIWYLKGNQKAYQFVESQLGFNISVVTYIELVQGMRNKHELNVFRNQFRNWNAKIIHINEEISAKAMFYIERNYLSHSLQLADALIGSTGLVHGMPIATGNDKHYKVISELEVIKVKI